MSPIGRVFLVLNLGLAGTFVAFAGSYLQRADNFKQLFDDKVKENDDLADRNRRTIAAVTQKVADREREVASLTTKSNGLDIKLTESTRKNQTLENRLVEMEGAMKKATSYMAKIDTSIATAVKDADAAMKMAIASEKARDDAVTAMNTAKRELDDANFKIKNQEQDIADKIALIANRDQDIRQKKVLLALVNRRHPGIFLTLHPLVTGSVSLVGASGNVITIALESGAENLKSGARFAIFSEKGYKGEATVSEIDKGGKFCFARVILSQAKIEVGDSASTNLSQGK